MKFTKNSPIYVQIKELVIMRILKGAWEIDKRVPSIRDLAVELEVNPNTVMRAYSELQDEEIIYNERGIGYFVKEEAREKIIEQEREKFFTKQLPQLFNKMDLLDIDIKQIEEYYNKYSREDKNEEINQ